MLERNIHFEASCEEILNIEEIYTGKEPKLYDPDGKKNIILYRTKFKDENSFTFYSCKPDRWYQRIWYGSYISTEQAKIALKKEMEILKEKYGEPIYDSSQLYSWWQKIILSFENHYISHTNLYIWQNKDAEISLVLNYSDRNLFNPSKEKDKQDDYWYISRQVTNHKSIRCEEFNVCSDPWSLF